MGEFCAGKRAELNSAGRLIVQNEQTTVGVFLVDGDVVAFENRCAHQGGPVCEGLVLGKVEAELGPDRDVIGEHFSNEELHLVCPWHGYEYDLRTGRCIAQQSLGLRRLKVEERDGSVYILV